MNTSNHSFHIPVMGTGHSADTPIRVGPFGISSVISLVDDLLLERIRKFYAEHYHLSFESIHKFSEDSRARRITAYLNTVQEVLHKRMEEIRALPFFQGNDKDKYFELLPSESPLRQAYHELAAMPEGILRRMKEKHLTNSMLPGSIDVNIMVKLDRLNFAKNGTPLSAEFSDARAALRGYANSLLSSAVVFSAGLNQGVFNYMSQFQDFYRNEVGEIKKKIILKVSDFRSAMVQGKLLARKGLEVHEFRIESGLNCGGHAFASEGLLLPTLLKEFKEKRDHLKEEFQPMVRRFYESIGREYPKAGEDDHPSITVQGGIGTHGEAKRMRSFFGMDRTGWATPFLLVPEATPIDDATRTLLENAREEDVYLSDVSPVGVPFNNVRGTGSERWTTKRAEAGTPGSPCPKGHLVSNTEFTQSPICVASREYQKQKLDTVETSDLSDADKNAMRDAIVQKSCICDHLGNGALIALGISPDHNKPQSICPSPNIAWFDRKYSLKEMVDHIYGRIVSLVPAERPHMFAKELVMYVDYFKDLVQALGDSEKGIARLRAFKQNLEEGMEYCLEIASLDAYADENLASIPPTVARQRTRLNEIAASYELVSVAV
jgi:hypothetical protein